MRKTHNLADLQGKGREKKMWPEQVRSPETRPVNSKSVSHWEIAMEENKGEEEGVGRKGPRLADH